jgi:hypothetical protein
MFRLVYGLPTFYSGNFFFAPKISQKNVGITQTPTSKWCGLSLRLANWISHTFKVPNTFQFYNQGQKMRACLLKRHDICIQQLGRHKLGVQKALIDFYKVQIWQVFGKGVVLPLKRSSVALVINGSLTILSFQRIFRSTTALGQQLCFAWTL